MKKYLVLAMVLLFAGFALAEEAVKNTDSKDLEGIQLRTVQPDYNHSIGTQPGMTTVNFITESFENAGSIPAGWTDSPGTSPWLYDGGIDHGPSAPNTGSYAAYFNIYDYTSGTIDSLISPSSDLSTGTGFNSLSFWGWHNSGTDSLVIYLSESGVLTRLDVMPNSSSWTQYTYNFYSSDTDAKIYFIGYSNYGSYNLYIDDVSLDDATLPTGDVAVNSIDAPAEVLLLAGTYTITATVENLDTDPATLDSLVFSVVDDEGSGVEVFHNVRIGDVIAGSSTSQLSSTVDWTVAVADWYAVTVSAYLDGDANPGDNSLTTTRIVQPVLAYPFEEDFEGGLVASIWDWVGFGTGFGYTTSNYHSPDTALWFSYSGYPNERIVVSPPVYVSGSSDPLFRFWEKSSGSSGPAGDETHVIGFVPGDWDLANLDTIFFDDSSSTMINVYRETMVDPGAIEGDTLRIVLWYHNTTSAAWNWYVDDISLNETPTGDVGPTDFVSGTGAIKNQAYSPVVEVTNYAGDTPDVPVKLVIDSMGVPVYTEWDTILAISAFGTANATFADYTPLESGAGIYNMTATTELVTVLLDNDPSNDTLTAAMTVYDALLDFEADDGGLIPSNDWEWGTPSGDSPPAYSGVNCWGTILSGDAHTNTTSNLVFRAEVNASNATVAFYQAYYSSSSSSYFYVITDDGVTVDTVDTWQGNNGLNWELYTIDLSAFSVSTVVTMTLSFAPGGYPYEGWYIDDLAFTGCSQFFPADDIVANSIDVPSGFMFTGATIAPAGTFSNVGTDAQTFDAIMTIEDTSTVIASIVYADTVTGVNLASGVSQQVVFDSWNVPSADAETYTFTMTAINPGDFNTADNVVSGDYDAYTHYSEGGPDAYGYMYYDNYSSDPLAPTYNWVELSTSPTADTAGTSSGTLGNFPIGFDFTYYGGVYDSVYINGYGYLSFGAMYSSGANDCPMPNSSTPNEPLIAVFWDYGYPYGTYDGATIYETFGTAPDRYMVIQYHNHRYSSYYDDMDFEVILHENGDVVMQYKHVGSPETSGNYGYGKYETVGIEDYDEYTSGLSYICNDDVVGNRLQDELAILWHYEAPAIDAAMSSVDEPFDGEVVFNGTTLTPTVTVTNSGDAATTVDVTFIINDGTTDVYDQTETTASIPGGGGTVQHSFATTWAANVDGAYDVTAYLVLSGDSNPLNDTLNTSFDVAAHYSEGGPDEYGYRWIDNISSSDEDPPVFDWVDLTTSPTADTAGTTYGNLGYFPIGFDFEFYGQTFDSVYINGYGYLQFGDYYSTSANDCPLPSTSSPYYYQIAGFWDSGYPSGTYDGATIYETFGTTPDRYMVIQYHNHKYSTYYNDMDWEIIIHENGNIVFQYLNIAEEATNYSLGQWATIGIQSDTSGTRYGITYLCNDDPIGNRLQDSLAVKWYVPVFAHDIVADQFNSPSSSSGLVNDPITPEVLFENNGTNDETNVPVRLVITPGTYDDPQTIAVLDSGTSYAQGFASFTPTSGGTYTLTAISELVGDEDPTSDTLVMTYTAYDAIIDFESDNGGLASGGDGDWEWGIPTNPEGPASAYSGVNLWATNLAGDYTTGLHTLQFQLALGTTPALGVASWYDTEASYDGGNFAISTDGGTTWIVISPDVGYTGVANTAHPPTGDSLFTGHVQGFWEAISFDLSAYAGMTVDARFAFGADGSVFYPGWHIDDLALADCAITSPDIDVSPLAVTGEADPLGVDYDTISVSNTGDGTLNFTAEAFMDETFTTFNGDRVPLNTGETHMDIRRGPSAFLAISNPVQDGQALEQRKAERVEKIDEGIYVPEFYEAPASPLPIIAVDIAYENFDDGLLPAGWSIVDGGNTSETWMPQSTNTCSRSGTYLFTDWFTVDSDCKIVSTDTLDEQLLTGYYDLSTYSPVRLAFGNNFQKYASYGDSGYVEVRNGSTGTWNLVTMFDYDVQSYEDLDITTLIGAGDSVQVRFHYMDRGDDCWYWMIDDFLLYEPDTPWLSIDVASGSIPPAGAAIDIEVTFDAEDVGPGIYTGRVEIASNDPDEGLVDVPATFIVGGLGTVAGQVTDANTTDPIEGAIVTATWVSTIAVVDTTDAGGNYSIDITPGTVNVTVEAAGYATDAQDVTVVEDQTTTHNVALTAPIATIDTTPIEDTVTVGDTESFSRYLYNTGTAPLDYNVSLSFGGGLLGLNINQQTDPVWVVNDLRSEVSEYAPTTFSKEYPTITAVGDLLDDFDSEVPTGDNGCLGIEFDGQYFWVTGRNASGGDIHKLHKFDSDGNWMISYDQGTTSTWGWRDLAWDGEYLYASDENEFAQIDPATGLKVGTLPMPSGLTVVRAVCYDPATDHFWAANFSSDIFEFDRTGAVINQYANTLSAYGMAWDPYTDGGPYLWVWHQGGTYPIRSHAAQFEVASGSYTGYEFDGVLPTGYDSTLAGGACITTDWQSGKAVLWTMNQAYPTDFAAGYEIAITETWATVSSGGSGTIAVDDSAEIVFLIDFTDEAIVADSTYEADANINNNSNDPTPIIHLAMYAEAGGCDYVTGDVNGSDSYNGLDITYGVAYFKGGSDPVCPFGSCPIPPCDAFFYCGDVNGSCSYNGLDITYGVAYFKGGPGPVPCPSCPPIGGPATIGNELKPTPQPAVETKSKSKKGNTLEK